MADTLSLEIVTPDGVKLNEQVTELTAPSVDGEFGVAMTRINEIFKNGFEP